MSITNFILTKLFLLWGKENWTLIVFWGTCFFGMFAEIMEALIVFLLLETNLSLVTLTQSSVATRQVLNIVVERDCTRIITWITICLEALGVVRHSCVEISDLAWSILGVHSLDMLSCNTALVNLVGKSHLSKKIFGKIFATLASQGFISLVLSFLLYGVTVPLLQGDLSYNFYLCSLPSCNKLNYWNKTDW